MHQMCSLGKGGRNRLQGAEACEAFSWQELGGYVSAHMRMRAKAGVVSWARGMGEGLRGTARTQKPAVRKCTGVACCEPDAFPEKPAAAGVKATGQYQFPGPAPFLQQLHNFGPGGHSRARWAQRTGPVALEMTFSVS